MEQRKILGGIFLFSCSCFSYEIVLTRIFSISLSYHFAFMVISIAMLGIGASGTVLALAPALKPPSGLGPVRARLSDYGLLLGSGITISYLIANHLPFDPAKLSWDRLQLLYICVYYLVLSLPFFFFGLSLSTTFSVVSECSGLLYGADLLGAGTGSLFLLYLMSVTGPENTIILISSAALAGAFITGGRKAKLVSLFLIASNISLFAMPGLISPRMSPYKGLPLALKYPGAEHIRTYYSPSSRLDTFRSPAARFAPGLSLRYLEALPEQIGLSMDGGEINAATDARGSRSLLFLKYLPSALAYELGKKDDVLVLDPKGGIEILLAGYYGSNNITKVESNPLVLSVIRSDLNRFTGGIYDADAWAGLGRSWLKTQEKKFDIVDIPLTGAMPSGSFGIAEDYRFTVEAFKEYLGHLKEDGILSIHLFIIPPPRTELRLLNTLVTSMEKMGMKDLDRKIVVIRSWGTVCILAKREPFTPSEIETVRRFSEQMRFDMVHLPGIKEEEANIYVKMPTHDYFRAFAHILDPAARTSFERDYLFDVRPVRDEAPFFHYHLKLGNMRAVYRVMGEKWQFFIEEGYLLPIVFLQVLLLGVILMILPAFSRRRNADGPAPSLLYFAFLGTGYMFVEVPLIQKMILPLENPSYAFAAVLTSMLISSGLGSLLSQRIAALKGSRAALVTGVLIAGYSLLLPLISDVVIHYPLPLRIASVFMFLLPLAFFMGIPFPAGLKKIGEKSPGVIPWAWAVNGCFSVLAPILAVMLAVVAGFTVILWIGAGAYLLAFLTFPAPKTQ